MLLCEEQFGAAADTLWPRRDKGEDENHYAEDALLGRTERQNVSSSIKKNFFLIYLFTCTRSCLQHMRFCKIS